MIKTNSLKKLPLILAIIGIIVSIAKGLGTPMIMGWDNILTAMGIGIAGGALYQMNAENSIEVGNITQDIKNDGYGYYNGKVYGDIFVGTNFDYLEVTMDFYDSQGKIRYSTIGWNELHTTSGNTYKFEGMYFKEKKTVKA